MDIYSLSGRFLRLLEAERAHSLTIRALSLGLGPHYAPPARPALRQQLFGLDFPNPIGLAAGFDKNAQVPDAMLRTGFGFVETGTVTPRAQPGNPRPRIFRLPEDDAVINRLGFNNRGLAFYKARLLKRRNRPGIVGANIGANKDSNNRIADYFTAFEALNGCADYFTVNVSSPNTPGLRGLQEPEMLRELLHGLSTIRARLPHKPPILLKIAPDLDRDGRQEVAHVARDSAIDGLIVSNTTIGGRKSLKSPHRGEQGGLSGKPLFTLSTEVLSDMYRLTEGELPLIGVGGVGSGNDAYRKIRAGASLVQLYTAMIYEGPALIPAILDTLAALLERDGFANIAEAVGADHNR